MSQPGRKRVDTTTGPILRKLAVLAWPLVIGNLLQTAYNIVDIFWVGRVSREAVAAVALMFPLSWMFVSTAMGITAATIALVSQYVGADRDREADQVVAQTMLLAIAVSAVLGVIGWIFRRQILRLMGASGQVFIDALAYIEVIFLALPLTFLFLGFRAALQGAGDTKTAMWLVVASVLVNVVLDPILILGWGPAPALGTRGAGWATFVARGLATLLGIGVLLYGGFGVRLRLGDLRPDPKTLATLIRIGAPASADGWARSVATVVMASFVTPFGSAAIAAYGVGVRIMSVTWSVAGAVGQATATGVGQNLGAGQPDRSSRVGWVATAATMGILAGFATLTLWIPDTLIRLFVDDQATVAEGVVFLWIVAPFWAFFGGVMVIQGGFRGAGRTDIAMVLSLLSRWVFRLPVAVFVAFSAAVTVPGLTARPMVIGLGVGVKGIWIAFAVGAVLSFLVAASWFRLHKWGAAVVEDAPTAAPAADDVEEAVVDE